MSRRCFDALRRFPHKKPETLSLALRCFSSRRSSTNPNGPFKIVKPKKPVEAAKKRRFADPNYELLAPSEGFPFILPGNVGPAWQNAFSTAQNNFALVMQDVGDSGDGDVICRVQACPRVLRETVCELFSYRNLEHSELSVVTVSLKADMRSMRLNKELETERMAQMFVITGQDICKKLNNAGYWADFINPFSGKPYIYPLLGPNSLYKSHEKFRCLDFQIVEVQDCKIISNEEDRQASRRFVGSLFTSAPAQKSQLSSIFNRTLAKKKL